MTPRQKKILSAAAILVALTRFAAVAKTMWDWDEGLFALAVDDYDVYDHRPHPPGYPLFIAVAKLLHLLGLTEFRALQSLVVLGSLFVVPAVFFLARELGFDFGTSLGGAVIFAFLPNVWLYGGTAFTDVPATLLALAACALLLRGRRDVRAYVAGAVVLALSAAIRPTNLLLAFVPAALATIARLRVSWRPVALAAILGAAIAGGSYLGAALATESIDKYRDVIRMQREWVRDVDSFQNPTRPSLPRLAPLFFVKPVQHEEVMYPIAILASLSFVAALVRRNGAVLWTVATFAPIAVFSWLQLDLASAARYAIAYMVAHALLAADGFRVLVRRASIQGALCVLLALVLAAWTWPALRVVRTSDAPPVAAMQWVRAHVPESQPLYIHGGLRPIAAHHLKGRRYELFDEELPRNGWVVHFRILPGARVTFTREHGRLWKIVRPRNFEASVSWIR